MTSTIIVRSSRLRSRWAVVCAVHSFGEVAGERLELLARGLRPRLVLFGELGLGFGDLAESAPSASRGGGDEPVLGLAGVKRGLGADRLIADTLDAQLDRPGRAPAPIGDLAGGGERQLDLLRRECLEQPAGDELVDDGPLDDGSRVSRCGRRASGCTRSTRPRAGTARTSSGRSRRSARSPGTAPRLPAAGAGRRACRWPRSRCSLARYCSQLM